jgi:hypothetical protein
MWYASPKIFSSDNNEEQGYVIIKIEGDPGATGTYAVGYSKVDRLIEDNPHFEIVEERTMRFYRFPVVKGMPYKVTWEDLYDKNQDSPHNGNIKVTGFYETGYSELNYLFSADHGFSSPQTVTNQNYSTSIVLRVEYSGTAGSYSIMYSPLPNSSVIDLEHEKWQDGEIGISGQIQEYEFPVTAGKEYRVYWNDSLQGDSTKSLDIAVSATYGKDEVPIFSRIDSGYSSPRIFTASVNGSVFIRVEACFENYTGTYSIRYTESAAP